MKRRPKLSIATPSTISLARASAFSKNNAPLVFKLLKIVRLKSRPGEADWTFAVSATENSFHVFPRVYYKKYFISSCLPGSTNANEWLIAVIFLFNCCKHFVKHARCSTKKTNQLFYFWVTRNGIYQ